MASIKEVAKRIKQHSIQHFNWKLYTYVAFFLVITIAINYTVDFEDSILDKSFKTPWGFLFYPLFYAFPYFAIAIPQAYWKKNRSYLIKSDFLEEKYRFYSTSWIYQSFLFSLLFY